MERHRKAKAKADKQERKKKDRLDFEFPSETARREKAREAKGKGRKEVDAYDVDGEGREAINWQSEGHVNFFEDLEKVYDLTMSNGPCGAIEDRRYRATMLTAVLE